MQQTENIQYIHVQQKESIAIGKKEQIRQKKRNEMLIAVNINIISLMTSAYSNAQKNSLYFNKCVKLKM